MFQIGLRAGGGGAAALRSSLLVPRRAATASAAAATSSSVPEGQGGDSKGRAEDHVGGERQADGRKQRRPRGFWQVRENRRTFLDGMRSQMVEDGVVDAEDASWMEQLRIGSVRAAGGATLLERYGNSLQKTLLDTYEADKVSVHRLPKGYFEEASHRRAFMDQLREEMGVRETGDWRKVTGADVKTRRGGAALLARYKSFAEMLTDVYPEEDLSDIHLYRAQVSQGHWQSAENRRHFMDKVKEELGVKVAEDWKKVTSRQVTGMGGGSLLNRYGSSLFDALRDIYPEENLTWEKCRKSKPQGFWQKAENRRSFLDGIAAEFSVRQPSDWRKVTTKDVMQRGGGALLAQYPSFWRALVDVYGGDGGGEAEWSALACRPTMPREFWQDEENVRVLVEHLERKFDVREKDDWYRLSYDQVVRNRGASLLKRMRLVDMLRMVYPEEDWDEVRFATGAKKSVQRVLRLAVEDLCRNPVKEDHRCDASTAPTQSPSFVELDVFVPAFNLAFEYNGEHHYHEIPHYGSLEVYQARDRRKKDVCKELGVRLVVVPYWWDRTAGSLLASVLEQYPSVGEELLGQMNADL